MRSFDIFNEHIGRIEFAKTKCNGKVLDVAYGEYLVYHTANILLDNKAEEVWSYDISEEVGEGIYYAGMASKAQYPERSLNGAIEAGYACASLIVERRNK